MLRLETVAIIFRINSVLDGKQLLTASALTSVLLGDGFSLSVLGAANSDFFFLRRPTSGWSNWGFVRYFFSLWGSSIEDRRNAAGMIERPTAVLPQMTPSEIPGTDELRQRHVLTAASGCNHHRQLSVSEGGVKGEWEGGEAQL